MIVRQYPVQTAPLDRSCKSMIVFGPRFRLRESRFIAHAAPDRCFKRRFPHLLCSEKYVSDEAHQPRLVGTKSGLRKWALADQVTHRTQDIVKVRRVLIAAAAIDFLMIPVN
jgi:hypothetical protein